MTRKARCGNTQKHTKMPEDATPWEELSRDIKSNARSSRGNGNKSTEECIEKKQPIEKCENESIEEVQNDTIEEVENNSIGEIKNESIEESESENELTEKIETESVEESENDSTEKVSLLEGPINQDIKIKGPNSLKKEDKVSNKKKFFLEKLQQRRLESGVTLLSPKQERKIYLVKRKLREKGFPPDAIKNIIRKKRRAEEILFRKTFTSKICFNCREKGHLLANCPHPLGSTNQVTGICFKCGSTEHVSYRCLKKVEGYPLAKCFVCKEQGHISKDCPKNKRGVYIKGGNCNTCGNVNHLQKDCPTLKKKKEEHVPVYTINEGTSIDAEIIEDATMSRKKMRKQPKVVKF